MSVRRDGKVSQRTCIDDGLHLARTAEVLPHDVVASVGKRLLNRRRCRLSEDIKLFGGVVAEEPAAPVVEAACLGGQIVAIEQDRSRRKERLIWTELRFS